MMRSLLLLVMLSAAVGVGGCRDLDGTIHVGSDPPERSENWDGDIDRIRHEKQRAAREASGEQDDPD